MLSFEVLGLVQHLATRCSCTVRRPEPLQGTKPGGPRSGLEDNVLLTYLKHVGWNGVEWKCLIQKRGMWCGVVNTIKKLRIS